MDKVLLFDIDDTIAYRNKKIPDKLIKELQKLSLKYHIVFVSGKPSCYIYGMLRQIEYINKISVIGENGATISIGSNFPPEIYYKYTLENKLNLQFSEIKSNLIKRYGDNIWFQPNEINLTIFPKSIELINDIYNYILNLIDENIIIYKHSDSVEILPAYINKKEAVLKYLELQNLNQTLVDIHAFGDSNNDLPMFDISNHIYLIGNKLRLKENHISIQNIDSLIKYLKENF